MKMIMSLKKKIQGRISKMPSGAYNACFPIMYMRNPEKKAMERWSGIIPEKELESCSQRFCSLSPICFFRNRHRKQKKRSGKKGKKESQKSNGIFKVIAWQTRKLDRHIKESPAYNVTISIAGDFLWKAILRRGLFISRFISLKTPRPCVRPRRYSASARVRYIRM